MVKKLLWTIVVIVFGVASTYALIDFLVNTNFSEIDWTSFKEWWEIILWVVTVWFPFWFAWKGTKLIPIITILPIRIILLFIGIFFPVLLIIFALIGIWFKS